MPASGPRSRGARVHPRSCQGCQPWPRASATSGLVLATQKLGGITGRGTSEEASVFRSLRFQLPALFLAAIVLAGLVSTAVAVSLSKQYAQTTLRKEAFRQLASEAGGITQIYAARSHKLSCPPPSLELERASGDPGFYIPRSRGVDVFPCGTPPHTLLPRRVFDFHPVPAGGPVQFEFTPPRRRR